MPKAEVGSTKYIANKLKSKGLQRLRWYCQVCEKQCRDANGFKMHTQSESHVRQMLVVGEDPKKFINDFSNQFLKDFVNLLRTGHGEKQVHINQFYQEYIANKEHVHMNATKWPSLTEFAKHLGREGICRVEENDKGLHVSWIDNSPEALRRQEALRKKDAMDQGDEEREQKMIREQIKRAQAQSGKTNQDTEGDKDDKEDKGLQRQEGQKISLSFGAKQGGAKPDAKSTTEASSATEAPAVASSDKPVAKPSGFAMKIGGTGKSQTKNVFSQAKKNALSSGSTKRPVLEQPKKMSEAERIMKEELERKRSRGSAGFGMPAGKKQKF